jgi:hypothetical protein
MTTTTATIAPASEELREAVRHSNLERVKRLIDNGVNLDEQDKYGMTALHYAVRYDSNIGIIHLLIDKGASLEIKNNHDKTPLEWANEGIGGAGEEERLRILQEAPARQQQLDEEKTAEAAEAQQRRIAANHNVAAANQAALKNRCPKVRLMP